jgi:hypothetical protein
MLLENKTFGKVLLNKETFEKVAQLAGYGYSQYQGVAPSGDILFRVSDVPEPSPWNGDTAMDVYVNEKLEIVDRRPHWCITEDGMYYYPWKIH